MVRINRRLWRSDDGTQDFFSYEPGKIRVLAYSLEPQYLPEFIEALTDIAENVIPGLLPEAPEQPAPTSPRTPEVAP